MFGLEFLMTFLVGTICMHHALPFIFQIGWNPQPLFCIIYVSFVLLVICLPWNLFTCFTGGLASSVMVSTFKPQLMTLFRTLHDRVISDRSTHAMCYSITRVNATNGRTILDRESYNNMRNTNPQGAQQMVSTVGQKEKEIVQSVLEGACEVETILALGTRNALQRQSHNTVLNTPTPATGC